ncbi:TAXI family TRAP transporter solute-binding subunit [Notoacmeibacter marinus]|uniref:TAXI family TRAP transporter solute-binding subunit n=1 Tax=Notoacmeibacter marinus TaxID=1876515 RepID=UPI000DF277C7|nr:TAXI family TRAP transporter solute-binding subunit [Notoacmeibacter marinus]
MKAIRASLNTNRRNVLMGGSAAALVGLLGAPRGLQAAEGSEYVLSTASTGGTFYPVGVAIATLTQVRLAPETGIRLNAINSAGSGENVYLLKRNEAQFAIMQSVFGHFARTGSGALSELEPQRDIRAIFMLWNNVEHPVIRNDFVDTGTIDDLAALKGHPVSFGRPNSGTIGSNTVMLNNLGYDLDSDFDLTSLSYNATVDAFMNGQIDGAIIGGGVPVGSVTRLMASAGSEISLLSYTEDQIAKANADLGIWSPYVIPAGTYPGQSQDHMTMATPNLLTCRSDVPDEHVYRIVKTMYENLPFLQAIHGATKEMALENAIQGSPLPIHPGAVSFYREAGVDVPQSLLAD